MAKNVAVVGVTGVVGQEMLNCLEKRNFPVGGIKVLASSRSAGKTVTFKGKDLTIGEATTASFAGVDIVLLAVEADQAREFAPADFPPTVGALAESLGFDTAALVAEVNGDIIRREQFAGRALRDGDVVELVRFVGGG